MAAPSSDKRSRRGHQRTPGFLQAFQCGGGLFPECIRGGGKIAVLGFQAIDEPFVLAIGRDLGPAFPDPQ